jgi:hypothetical protein
MADLAGLVKFESSRLALAAFLPLDGDLWVTKYVFHHDLGAYTEQGYYTLFVESSGDDLVMMVCGHYWWRNNGRHGAEAEVAVVPKNEFPFYCHGTDFHPSRRKTTGLLRGAPRTSAVGGLLRCGHDD